MTNDHTASEPLAEVVVENSMHAEQLAYIRRLVDEAPALSGDQLIRLGRLLEAIPLAA